MRRATAAVVAAGAAFAGVRAVLGSPPGRGRGGTGPGADPGPTRPPRRIDPFGDSDPTPYAEWHADGSPVVPTPTPDDAARSDADSRPARTGPGNADARPVRLSAPIRVRIADLPEHARPTDVTEN